MKKYKNLLFILAFIALLLSQYKLVMPLMYKIAASDLFLVDSKDQASQLPISTTLTSIAYMHCNHTIKSEIGPDAVVSFPEKPLNAWSMGNYDYLIHGEYGITDQNSKATSKNYTCRIAYKNGDDQEGILDFDNWSIVGLSGLEHK
jgi:hypothetical protein